jgi:glycosyltransferase involved in cell wall biosynthesis
MNPTRDLRSAARRRHGVRIVGFVEDVRPHIGAAAVYVCPILDGGGTRLKILDAMAMGKAIIATPLAAEGIDVSDGREIVIRDFGDDFVRGVLDALRMPGLRRALGASARAKAESAYDWNILGATLLGAYADARSRSPRPRVPPAGMGA